jgi:hypothetical protein
MRVLVLLRSSQFMMYSNLVILKNDFQYFWGCHSLPITKQFIIVFFVTLIITYG